MTDADVRHVCTLDTNYRNNKELWMKLVNSRHLNRSSCKGFWESADPSLARDHGVACAWLAKCTKDVLSLLDQALFTNVAFLRQILSMPARSHRSFDLMALIKAIPKDAQIQIGNELLSMQEVHLPLALEGSSSNAYGVREYDTLFTLLHPSVGTDESFKTAWFKAGGGYQKSFPKQWWLEGDIFALMAKSKWLNPSNSENFGCLQEEWNVGKKRYGAQGSEGWWCLGTGKGIEQTTGRQPIVD